MSRHLGEGELGAHFSSVAFLATSVMRQIHTHFMHYAYQLTNTHAQTPFPPQGHSGARGNGLRDTPGASKCAEGCQGKGRLVPPDRTMPGRLDEDIPGGTEQMENRSSQAHSCTLPGQQAAADGSGTSRCSITTETFKKAESTRASLSGGPYRWLMFVSAF